MILTLDGKEVARADLKANKIQSCRIVDEASRAALKKSRFQDFARSCK